MRWWRRRRLRRRLLLLLVPSLAQMIGDVELIGVPVCPRCELSKAVRCKLERLGMLVGIDPGRFACDTYCEAQHAVISDDRQTDWTLVLITRERIGDLVR